MRVAEAAIPLAQILDLVRDLHPVPEHTFGAPRSPIVATYAAS